MFKGKNTCDTVAVIIPIYKTDINENERASLRQVLLMLKNHPILFFCPQNLSVEFYKNFCHANGYTVTDKNFIRFNDEYFTSIDGYNKLLISKCFYKTFGDYEFVLIYQLDAWVFHDELVYWCNQNYDYIGSPWYEQVNGAYKYLGVGNGGFSLRNVKSHLRVLSTLSYIRPPVFYWNEFKQNKNFRTLVRFILSSTVKNNTHQLFNNFKKNEDGFWGLIASQNFTWFKVPDQATATKFAFEKNANYLFERNENKLPFGCHKWESYEPEFWASFIKVN